MWPVFAALKSRVNFKPKHVNIDNYVFKLHYRFTFWTLLIIAGVLWTTDSFGEKIRCTHSRAEDKHKSNEQLDHVINSWCYFMGVFTVPRHHVKNDTNRYIQYPGVGPVREDEPTQKIRWYPWVPYFILFQAFSFYIGRLSWRLIEGRVIYNIVKGYNVLKVLEEEPRKKTLEDVSKSMFYRLEYHRFWAFWLTSCEIINLVNLVLQWFLTDTFLQGSFNSLGYALFEHKNASTNFNTLDIAFPKMAKCTYNKIGNTGGIQNTDILCFLSYNLVYEKVYLILWFWYMILMTITAMALVHRFVSWFAYKFNLMQYNISMRGTSSNKGNLFLLKEHISYGQFLFLQYLTSNIDKEYAADLIEGVANSARQPALAGFYKDNLYPLNPFRPTVYYKFPKSENPLNPVEATGYNKFPET